MANSVEFPDGPARERAFAHKLSFFTHSVNSVTAAFGASWHHRWIQQLRDIVRCRPRQICSP